MPEDKTKHIDGLIVQNDDGSRWLSLDEPFSISAEYAREIMENATPAQDWRPIDGARTYKDGLRDGYEFGMKHAAGVVLLEDNAKDAHATIMKRLETLPPPLAETK